MSEYVNIAVESDEVFRAIRLTSVLESLPEVLVRKIKRIEDGEGVLVVSVREPIGLEDAMLLKKAWADHDEPSGHIEFYGQCLFDFFDMDHGVSA